MRLAFVYMFGLPATVDIPLSTDAYGAIRVSGTRVLLDVIIVAFQAGATPEDIAQQFPSVALPDVYLVIAHYLTHTADIDAYLSQRRIEAARLQSAIETRFNPVGFRARLLARQHIAR
jgi:uncharacterized protein (DUF433 family)